MGSLTPLLIFVAIVEFSLYSLGISTSPATALFAILTNPGGWASSGMGSWIMATLGVIAVTSAVLGMFWKSDTFLFAGLGIIFLSFIGSLASLYNILSATSNPFMAVLIVGPITIAYIMLAINWIRGRD